MYGCWNDFQVTRTIDKAASASIGATAVAAATTGSGSSPSSASTSTSKASKSGGSHSGIIAAAAIVGVLVVLIIAGLVAYILRLRSRTAAPAPTELQKVGSGPSAPGSAWDVVPGGAAKLELSGGAGANAWEMGGREIQQIPGGPPGAGMQHGGYNPAAGSVRYPGGQSPAPSWAPRTPEGQYPCVEAPAHPHSFLEMDGSGAGGQRGWNAELPG